MMNIKREDVVIQVNKDGFTVWKHGFIAFDCPLKRAERDSDVALAMLKLLHDFLVTDENKEETTR